MSPIRIIILVIAAAAAVLAAFMVKNMSKAPPPETVTVTELESSIQEVQVSEIQVLVARSDFEIGQLLTEADFEWAPWPEANIVEGYITEEDNPDALEELSGSVVRRTIYEREPILPVKLVTKGETGYMAALLTPGMRAMSVEISTESASGGFILPDDRVDVILTHEVEIPNGEFTEERPVTTTIIQNVRVLAVDQIFRQDDSGVSAVIGNVATLELSPREVELLALAGRMGSLSLSLRSWSDASEGRPVASRLDFLRNASPGGKNSGTITVYRNGKPTSDATLGGS